MKRTIDYVIHKTEGEKLLFRFYPRSSHVHGFTDEAPTTWNAVYKTYFSWAIISQNRWDKHDEWKAETMYEEGFDECSALDQLSSVLESIIAKKNKETTYTLYSFGDGTSWILNSSFSYNHSGEKNVPVWIFQLWQNYTHKGYYFILEESQLQEFKDTIDYFLEYMLQHSEGI